MSEEVVFPDEVRVAMEELLRQQEALENDPQLLEAAEEMHRRLGYISPEELMRQFTI